MNATDTKKLTIALALAKCFDHGWAGFADAAEGAETIEDAFEKIADAMTAWEKANPGAAGNHPNYGAGLRPSLTHETMTGRIRWAVDNDRTRFSINRPDGPVIECTVSHGCRNGCVLVHGASLGRHVEAARWMCNTLGADGLFHAILFRSSLAALREYAEIRGADTELVATAMLADCERAAANRAALRASLDRYPAASSKL